MQLVDPWQNPPELEAVNPLSQIPVLVLDDGKTAVPGTLPICLYLGGAMPPAAELSAVSQTHALLEMLIQIVKLVRFKAPDTADHPLVERCVTALKRALARVPAFDSNSQAWPDVMLAVVLLTVKLRRPEESRRLHGPTRRRPWKLLPQHRWRRRRPPRPWRRPRPRRSASFDSSRPVSCPALQYGRGRYSVRPAVRASREVT